MGAYTDAVTARDQVRADRERAVERHRRELAEMDRQIAYAQQVIDVAEAGGPAEAFMTARRLLRIEWARHRQPLDRYKLTGPRRVSGVVLRQIDRAIADVQAGCPAMRREYFGVKEYSGFSDQECDCRYGYGPSHGSIWFSIGLQNPKVELSEDERIACVQWLRALRENPELLP